jgi:cytochrome c peroxidase
MVHLAHLPRQALALLLAAGLAQATCAATPAELLAGYVKQAGAPASPARGQKLFTTPGGGDFDWSCATCHTADPMQVGQHAVSGKPIPPLAPAANPARFTNSTQVEFHFKLNCKDVIGRECTPGQKADVMSWLLSLKR